METMVSKDLSQAMSKEIVMGQCIGYGFAYTFANSSTVAPSKHVHVYVHVQQCIFDCGPYGPYITGRFSLAKAESTS